MTTSPIDPSPAPKWLLRAGLALAATLAALALCELGVRIGWDDPSAAELERLSDGREMILRLADDPELGYELTPNAEGHAWGTDVRVNAHGLRGPEVELDKRGRYRVAVVGDSIAFGNFLPESEVFPYRLAALLEERAPGGYDVLNFAVGGYDIAQEVATVEQKVLAFDPDLVVLAMCLNDAGIQSVNRDYLDKLQARWRSPLFRSHLYRFVAHLLGREQLATADERANEPAAFAERYRDVIDPIGADEAELRALMAAVPRGGMAEWYADEDRVGRIRHGLRRLAELGRRAPFDALVVVIPWLAWSDGQYPFAAVHRILHLECQRAGLPVMDITGWFITRPFASLRARPDDFLHPNELGHRILAEQLADYVLARASRAR